MQRTGLEIPNYTMIIGFMKTDRLLQYALAGALAVLSVVIWDAMRDKTVNAGDTAPDFEVSTSNGSKVRLSSFAGKVVVLNFWATWCPPCVKETPLLVSLHNETKDRGLVLLAVSVDKTEAKYRNFLERFGIAYLTARDPEQRVNGMYGTFRYPETYVIDKTGKVAIKKVGEMDAETVRQIKQLL